MAENRNIGDRDRKDMDPDRNRNSGSGMGQNGRDSSVGRDSTRGSSTGNRPGVRPDSDFERDRSKRDSTDDDISE